MPETALSRLEARLSDLAGAPVELERPNDPEHGDYATNVAMQLAPRRKRQRDSLWRRQPDDGAEVTMGTPEMKCRGYRPMLRSLMARALSLSAVAAMMLNHAALMPASAAKLLDLLAVPPGERQFDALGASSRIAAETALPAPSPVFPRYVESEASAQSRC